MKVLVGFIAGAIVGIAIGIASSIVYSGQTGKDLREVYKDVRKNVESVDLEQFGQEVRTNVAQAQAQIEETAAQVRGKSGADGSAASEATAEEAGL